MFYFFCVQHTVFYFSAKTLTEILSHKILKSKILCLQLIEMALFCKKNKTKQTLLSLCSKLLMKVILCSFFSKQKLMLCRPAT